MNAERLLAHYEKIADAPDAIARLRRFILDLAVRGKLVPQDANDEPASELLKRLKHERTRREKLKAIKRIKLQYGPIALDTDFKLPSGWVKATIGQTCDLQTGATPDRNRPEFFGGDIRWLVSGDINRGEIFDCDGRITKLGLDSSNCKILPQNCVLIALNGQGKTRATVALLRTQAACNQSLVAIIPLLPSDFTPEYLHLSLKARYVAIRELTGKDERRGLNMRLLECFEIAIPPLAEQHRIVAKVDELMALCDRLETARAAREAVRDRLAAASLARLNAPDPETFQADARFTLNALPALTTRPDQIKQLRQTILNLAVRGKLVPQDPNDEPASELLKRIAKKRAELLRAEYPNPDEARTQNRKLAEQSVPDGLEALPMGWSWATLLQCSALVIDCKNKTAPYASSGIRLIRTTNVRDGRMNLNDQKYVDQKTYEIWSARCTPEPGDILITREAPMGEVCLIPPSEQICLGQRMMLARLVPDTIDRNFMIYSLRDPRLMDRVQDKPIGATVQHLRVGGVETLLVPLPPLAEQHRIVAKVDALMALCDQLEVSLTDADNGRRRLLDALLAEALRPPADQREAA